MTRATMTLRVPIGTAGGGVRYVLVSLPRVDCLIVELPQKYFLPGDAPAPSRSDLSARTPVPRAPSLRFLVKMALKNDRAEQLSERLRLTATPRSPPPPSARRAG